MTELILEMKEEFTVQDILFEITNSREYHKLLVPTICAEILELIEQKLVLEIKENELFICTQAYKIKIRNDKIDKLLI